MQNKILVFLLFLVSAHIGVCQSPRLTKEGKLLWQKISSGKADTNMVYNYLDYGYLWENSNLDSAGDWYRKAGDLSNKLKFPLGQIKFRTNYTYVLNLKGDFQNSLKLNLEALEIARKNPDLKYEGKCLANVGSIYIYKSEYLLGVNYYQLAADWFEAQNQPEFLPAMYLKMGVGLSRAGLHERSETILLKALKLSKIQNDSLLILDSYGALSKVLYNMDRFEESLTYCEESILYSNALFQQIILTESILTKGACYRKLKKTELAKRYLELGLKRLEGTENVLLKVQAIKDLYLLNFEQGNYGKAEVFMEELIKLALQMDDQEELSAHYQSMAFINEKKGDFKKAYSYLKRFTVSYDSVQGKALKMQLQELDARFQTSEKEKAILKLEKEKQIQELAINQRNTWLAGGGLAFAAALLIGFLTIRNNRQKIDNLQKEKQVEALSGIIKGEENERNRMAQDLHDGLGSLLSGVKLSLTSLKGGAYLNENQTQLFGHSLEQLDGAIAEMRRVAHNLMPAVLIDKRSYFGPGRFHPKPERKRIDQNSF